MARLCRLSAGAETTKDQLFSLLGHHRPVCYKVWPDDKAMHQEIDAVFVATPDHHHAPASLRAIQLGRHVFCEKPLCHGLWQARALAQAATKHKVTTMMGNQGHCDEGYRRLCEYIRWNIPDREGLAAFQAHWYDGAKLPAGADARDRKGSIAVPNYPPRLAEFEKKYEWDLHEGFDGGDALHRDQGRNAHRVLRPKATALAGGGPPGLSRAGAAHPPGQGLAFRSLYPELQGGETNVRRLQLRLGHKAPFGGDAILHLWSKCRAVTAKRLAFQSGGELCYFARK